MREILFRGKRKDGKGWAYGDLNQNDIHNGVSIRTNGCIITSVLSETIGQFTGLLDKSGIKIFENDKIKYNNWIGVVKFNLGAFYIDYDDHTESEFNEMSSSELEIIGNIHD